MPDPSRYVDSAALPWRPTPYPGIAWKKLRYDAAAGASAVLLRFEPGARYGRHRHPAGEQYLVLAGSLEDGGRRWGEGAYVHHPPGSVHAPSSAEGCVVYVTLGAPIEDLEGPPPAADGD
ncbi:MAG: dimethylsulfonioproprionate lyase family protein [Synechococcaceae cyanobacterium]|nr:dimethylsulfonioproprionate lyase family protein [Synechococcaceae cyanobacterium]